MPKVKVPLHRLTKAQIVKLGNTRCKHGHTFLEHYGCYTPVEERIGFLDIEASNLDADYGQMLSYCIKDSGSKDILCDVITKEDLQAEPGKADKRIVESCIRDIGKFDKLVTFYGARFDLPFIRTRAMVTGVPFPTYGTIVHKDIYFTIRGKMKLSSNRLENACRVLLGKTNKTRIEPKHWHGALQGNQDSLDFVLKHNKYDVIDLEKLYWATINFSRPNNNSI